MLSSGMIDSEPLNRRKLEHLQIVRNQPVEPVPSPFDAYRLPYKALPEIDMAEIETGVQFLGRQLSIPLLISSMTGGPEKAGVINRNLAIAAEEVGVAMGLGSMRTVLKHPETLASFQVRKFCPSVPLFANMGLVQLNYGYGASEINSLIDAVEADGIFLHVNPLQEAIQPEGDTNFKDLLPKLERLIPKIKAPIIIKEVGSGIDPNTAQRLADIGVQWVDVAGMGGTSWAWVEGYRREDRLGALFRDVGLTTDQALLGASTIKGLQLIGSGGIRSGLDMAKALMLGANIAGSAKPFLEPALESAEACVASLAQFELEFRTAMFCVGARNVAQLKEMDLQK